jgi:hypothetical protein
LAERSETTLDTILHLKHRDPFNPFRIVMASGDKYLIEDPDGLAVASSQLHYYPRFGMGVHLRINQVVAVEEPDQQQTA